MKGDSAVPLVLVAVLAAAAAKEFSNTWVAEIDGGEEGARLVAKQLGFEYGGAIEEFDDHHILTREDHPEVSNSDSYHLTKSLLDHDQVKWAQQQSYVKRSLRDNRLQSLLTAGRKLTPLEVVEFVQIICVSLGELNSIPSATVNQPVSNTGPPQQSQDQNRPQRRPHKPGAVYVGGQLWDLNDPNFKPPEGVIISVGGITYGGKPGTGLSSMLAHGTQTWPQDEPQGDISKLGTFSTKPNFDSLSTYEGVTKNIRLRSSKESAYKSRWIDPLWEKQWYLQDYRTKNGPVMDLNVVPVWDYYDGSGIVIGVVDDGIEEKHPDLVDNYLKDDSYDYVNTRPGSQPELKEDGTLKSHGTMCAGEIAMVAGNNKCGVGIAHKANIIGIKSLADRMKVVTEGRSQIYKLEKIDIYSNSWGPIDNGKFMEKMTRTTELAFIKGVIKGRNGKGAVYTFAGGNGKHIHDNCAADFMVNNINVIGVAPVSQNGKVTPYGERCTAIFCAAYSSSYASDEMMVSTTVQNECTTSFTGTSAATPLVTAVIALVLQANNKLTYRDVMHIITMGCEVAPVADNEDIWYRNGKGFWVSNDFGFGLINAENMVNLAKYWVNVPKLNSCTSGATLKPPQEFAVGKLAVITFDAQACQNTPDAVNYLEAIVITPKIKFSFRGAIAIHLTSPQGTRSHILEVRPEDRNSDGLDNWPIKSLHNWGEDPKGTWKFEVRATALGGRTLEGVVESVSLTFYGTATPPAHYRTSVPRTYSDFRLPNGKTSKDRM